MEYTDIPIYPLKGKQLTREEVRILVAEAHVLQKRADLRGVFLGQANLSGTRLPLSWKERFMQRIRDLSHPFKQIE